MAEPHRVHLLDQLVQLAHHVGADGGASLYLDDGDGVLEQVASTVPQPTARDDLLSRLRRTHTRGEGTTLVLNVPDAQGGILVLERRSREAFSQEDRAVARLHARRLVDAVAIPSRQLRSSVWTRQLETVQRVAARLTRLASLDELGATICAELRRVIQFDEAHVLVFDGSGARRNVAVFGAPVDADGGPCPLTSDQPGGRAIATVLADPTPLLLPRVAELGPEREGEWSLLVAPLSFEGRAIGAISLLRRGVGGFDDSHQRILQILADQAAVAVENARLLARRDELVDGLGVLLQISQAAAEASGERQLGDRLAERMRTALRVDACAIARRDEGSTILRTVGRSGTEGPDLIADSAALRARRSVLTDGQPRLLRADRAEDAGPELDELIAQGGRTLLLVPLRAGGAPLGLVELVCFEPRTFGEAEMGYIQTMCSLASTGLERARLLEQLRLAADIDPTTGVNNKRYLRTRMRQEVARASRSGSPLSVLMLDLDDFKPINDRYGHPEGDRVLARVASTIRSHVRTVDIVARYGGDEFVVVMPDTAAERAAIVARRVVRGVRNERHPMANGEEARVGISGGLALYPRDGRTAASLLAAADAQMYSDKRGSYRSRELGAAAG